MKTIVLLAMLAGSAFAADPIADIYDGQVKSIEREIFGLAQKMPADKYDFAPTNGTFNTVRTFALQVRHIATVMYMVSASVLDEKMPVEIGTDENGSDSLKTKDQIIAYFQASLAYSHKAMSSLTQQNMNDKVIGMGGRGTTTRIASAAFIGLHSYDHYGQMVVYARTNNVVPGNAPPANAKGKAKGQ